MRKKIFQAIYPCIAITFISVTELHSQKDWELPVVNDRIQYEFNSNKLNLGKVSLCETYKTPVLHQDFARKLQDTGIYGNLDGGGLSKTFYSITPTALYGANVMTTSDPFNAKIGCNPSAPDTLFGSLHLVYGNVGYLRSGNSYNVTALFRIILFEDSYNLKIRGFKGSAGYENFNKNVSDSLEKIYNPIKPKKSEKEFYSYLNYMMNRFHQKLEESINSQVTDLDWDD